MPTVVDLGRAKKAQRPGIYDSVDDAALGRAVKARYPGAYDSFTEPDPNTGVTMGPAPNPIDPSKWAGPRHPGILERISDQISRVGNELNQNGQMLDPGYVIQGLGQMLGRTTSAWRDALTFHGNATTAPEMVPLLGPMMVDGSRKLFTPGERTEGLTDIAVGLLGPELPMPDLTPSAVMPQPMDTSMASPYLTDRVRTTGAVARGAAKGVIAEARKTVPLSRGLLPLVTGLPEVNLPAPIAGAIKGAAAGEALTGLKSTGGIVGGATGVMMPLVRGAVKGGRTALRDLRFGEDLRNRPSPTYWSADRPDLSRQPSQAALEAPPDIVDTNNLTPSSTLLPPVDPAKAPVGIYPDGQGGWTGNPPPLTPTPAMDGASSLSQAPQGARAGWWEDDQSPESMESRGLTPNPDYQATGGPVMGSAALPDLGAAQPESSPVVQPLTPPPSDTDGILPDELDAAASLITNGRKMFSELGVAQRNPALEFARNMAIQRQAVAASRAAEAARTATQPPPVSLQDLQAAESPQGLDVPIEPPAGPAAGLSSVQPSDSPVPPTTEALPDLSAAQPESSPVAPVIPGPEPEPASGPDQPIPSTMEPPGSITGIEPAEDEAPLDGRTAAGGQGRIPAHVIARTAKIHNVYDYIATQRPTNAAGQVLTPDMIETMSDTEGKALVKAASDWARSTGRTEGALKNPKGKYASFNMSEPNEDDPNGAPIPGTRAQVLNMLRGGVEPPDHPRSDLPHYGDAPTSPWAPMAPPAPPVAGAPPSVPPTPAAAPVPEVQSGRGEPVQQPAEEAEVRRQPAGEVGQTGGYDYPVIPRAVGEDTQVLAAGRKPYSVQYIVRELKDVIPSHNPFTFQPNPDYDLTNDRDYTLPENEARVTAGTLNPAQVINDNPDSVNGPPIIDRSGLVLGGNSRTMRIARAYAGDPADARGYRSYLIKKARNFGIDPTEIDKMKQPVLVRELGDEEVNRQQAITDFNKDPQAKLSLGEQAAADARYFSPEMGKYIGSLFDMAPQDATLTDVLNSSRGPDVVNKLINEGVFTTQERPSLLDAVTGKVTKIAKDRISKMMLGKLFEDSSQLQSMEPALRNKLERAAPRVIQTEAKSEWNVLPDLRQAVDAIDYEREFKKGAIGKGYNIGDAKSGKPLFEPPPPTPLSARGRVLADFIRSNSPTAISRAFRDYAGKSESGDMFNPVEPGIEFGRVFAKPELPTGGPGVSDVTK